MALLNKLPFCVRINFDDAQSREALRKDGWREIEVLETWECRTPFPSSRNVRVRLIEPGDVPACEQIAETAFEFDRLHIDPKVPDDLANEHKRGAVRNAMAGCCQIYVAVDFSWRNDGLTLPRLVEQAVGFNIVKRDGPVAVIDLIAVAKGWQRRGVGQALLRAVLTPDTEIIRAGTQAVNEPARNLYRRCGFSLVKKQRTFHKDRPVVAGKKVVALVA